MYELKIITHFAAAHQLKLAASKCENLHGHNWKIEAFIAGTTLNEAGILMDFGDMKALLGKIIDKLDHKFLNELPFFGDGNPSSENVACFIATELQAAMPESGIRVSRITAWESENACATYIPD